MGKKRTKKKRNNTSVNLCKFPFILDHICYCGQQMSVEKVDIIERTPTNIMSSECDIRYLDNCTLLSTLYVLITLYAFDSLHMHIQGVH